MTCTFEVSPVARLLEKDLLLEEESKLGASVSCHPRHRTL